MRNLFLGAALLLCAGFGNAAFADPPSPGGVEIRAVHGHFTRLRAFGYADLEQGVPMRTDAVMRIASLTKQFTAVAVLRLVQDGKLTLDDTIAQRLPDCPTTWRPIKIRQLLNQTSGLSSDLSLVGPRSHDDWTPRQLIELYANNPVAPQVRVGNTLTSTIGSLVSLSKRPRAKATRITCNPMCLRLRI